jgi:hypothetical protein
MILSKLITAKRREAIAAPAIADRATIFINEAVFFTVDGASGGSQYADDILLVVNAFPLQSDTRNLRIRLGLWWLRETQHQLEFGSTW